MHKTLSIDMPTLRICRNQLFNYLETSQSDDSYLIIMLSRGLPNLRYMSKQPKCQEENGTAFLEILKAQFLPSILF